MLGGLLLWSKRFEHPCKVHPKTKMRITEMEVPFEYRGPYKSKAVRSIEEAIYRKITKHETYLIKNVDFEHQVVEAVKYEF